MTLILESGNFFWPLKNIYSGDPFLELSVIKTMEKS